MAIASKSGPSTGISQLKRIWQVISTKPVQALTLAGTFVGAHVPHSHESHKSRQFNVKARHFNASAKPSSTGSTSGTSCGHGREPQSAGFPSAATPRFKSVRWVPIAYPRSSSMPPMQNVDASRRSKPMRDLLFTGRRPELQNFKGT
jgi:hypothetical protein